MVRAALDLSDEFSSHLVHGTWFLIREQKIPDIA
jgi:hypothetical protein